jgi:hypothetical protein
MPAQPEPTDRAEVTKLAAAVEEALAEAMPTRVRDDDPEVPSWADGSRIGTTLPVTQPGRAPMSSGAVDYCARILSTGVAASLFSGSIALIMAASQAADPVVCGIVFGAPIGLAVPIAAVSSLLGKAKQVVEATPPEIHNHYNGPVHQDQRHTQSRNTGVWVKNTNEQ